jgi:hypothetical protein
VFVVLIVHKANVFIPNLTYHHSALHKKNKHFLWHIACVKQLFGYITRSIIERSVMAGEETRHDLWIKRINTWIGILGGSVASIAGAYNFLPSVFPPAQGEIAAVVREQGGAPLGRAHVELLTSQNILLGTSETDRDGRYIKKDLEPGSYILKVRRGGFEPQVATVNVASKKTTDLELVLRVRSRAQAPTNPPAASTSQTQGNTSPQAASTPQAEGNAIRSALEETGAAWIKSLGKPGR